jgi:hypothetical protein
MGKPSVTPIHLLHSSRSRRASKVTTGRNLFVQGGDGRSAWALRWKDLILAHVADLGGPELLSEAQISICRRWIMLQILRLRARMPEVENQTYPHQAIYAKNQRQGRALHPNVAAGMGLCKGLPELKSARPEPAVLDPPIQLASPTRQPKINAAHQPPRSHRGQPIETPQLVAGLRV